MANIPVASTIGSVDAGGVVAGSVSPATAIVSEDSSPPVTDETIDAQVGHAPVVPMTTTYPAAAAGRARIARAVLRIGMTSSPEVPGSTDVTGRRIATEPRG
jgi:hypothetical protein